MATGFTARLSEGAGRVLAHGVRLAACRGGAQLVPAKEWVDPAAALPENAVNRDRILDNVSLYWFAAAAGGSANLYYEVMHDPASQKRKRKNNVPTGVAVSPTQDVTICRWADRENDIVRWTELDRGGHFAALEVPDLLVADVRAFFRGLRSRR